jgi:biopolymer transport protein TolR
MTAMAFSTIGTTGSTGLSSEINITPLIDVLLVLLIIFMVIVPAVPNGLGAELPSASPGHAVDQAMERPVFVELRQGPADVQYCVDGVSLNRTELVPRLMQMLARRSTRRIQLKADAGLDYGVVSSAIDAGETAGVDSVGLVTPGSERKAD